MTNETAQEVPELVQQLNAAFYLGQVRALRTWAFCIAADALMLLPFVATCLDAFLLSSQAVASYAQAVPNQGTSIHRPSRPRTHVLADWRAAGPVEHTLLDRSRAGLLPGAACHLAVSGIPPLQGHACSTRLRAPWLHILQHAALECAYGCWTVQGLADLAQAAGASVL